MTDNHERSIQEISKSMHVIPRFMHYFFSSFKPQVDIPIKKSEIKALFEISAHPNLPMQHYTDFVDMENSSFTYLTDKLDKKGLLKKIQDTEDKRKTVLRLTEYGENLCADVKKQFGLHIKNLIVKLEKDDLEKLSSAFISLNEVFDCFMDKNDKEK